MKELVVGLVGAGYAAFLHINGYQKVSGVPVRLKSITDLDLEKAEAFRKTYGIEEVASSFEAMLADPEITVIDLLTPPFLHAEMVEQVLKAGKHVICEKPLTGYFGSELDPTPIGEKVPKEKMYREVLASMDKLRELARASGKQFLYAENYVYATPVQKAAEIIRRRKSKILYIKGESYLKGSSSPVAGEWKYTGGGTLIRVGCHPLSGILWLKAEEAKARGEEFKVVSINAEVGQASKAIIGHEHRHISAKPQDVEDFANLTLTFSDGSKGVVLTSDTALGGTKNCIDIYCNDNALLCNLNPTDMLNSYFLDEVGLEDFPLSEMLPAKLGWNKVFVSDEVIRGYLGELQDFAEAIYYDRPAQSGFDLAYLTTQIVYAAYVSAEEGRPLYL